MYLYIQKYISLSLPVIVFRNCSTVASNTRGAFQHVPLFPLMDTSIAEATWGIKQFPRGYVRDLPLVCLSGPAGGLRLER